MILIIITCSTMGKKVKIFVINGDEEKHLHTDRLLPKEIFYWN